MTSNWNFTVHGASYRQVYTLLGIGKLGKFGQVVVADAKSTISTDELSLVPSYPLATISFM